GSVPLVDGPSRAGLDLLLSSPALADELEPAALTAAASALTTQVAADLAALPLGGGSDGLAELRRRLEFLFLFKPHITPELFWELTLGLVTSPHAASLWRSLSVEDAV